MDEFLADKTEKHAMDDNRAKLIAVLKHVDNEHCLMDTCTLE